MLWLLNREEKNQMKWGMRQENVAIVDIIKKEENLDHDLDLGIIKEEGEEGNLIVVLDLDLGDLDIKNLEEA